MHARPIRVALVDDHAMIREGLKSILRRYEDIEVVAEAADGISAIVVADEAEPHVVIMDVNMPRMNGVQATAHIKARHPRMKVVGVSVNAREWQESMTKAGADTLIPKEAAVDEIYEAIKRAAA